MRRCHNIEMLYMERIFLRPASHTHTPRKATTIIPSVCACTCVCVYIWKHFNSLGKFLERNFSICASSRRPCGYKYGCRTAKLAFSWRLIIGPVVFLENDCNRGKEVKRLQSLCQIFHNKQYIFFFWVIFQSIYRQFDYNFLLGRFRASNRRRNKTTKFLQFIRIVKEWSQTFFSTKIKNNFFSKKKIHTEFTGKNP